MSKKIKTIEELLEEALVADGEQPYEVPDNWMWVRLGSVVNFFSGSAFPNQFQGYTNFNIPFYKVGSLKDIDSDYYIFNEDNTISEEMRIQLKAKLVPKDTILFAKIGEAIRLNRRSLVSKPACIDNNLMGFRGKEKVIENKFLLFWSLKESFYKYSQASAVPSIRKSTLENISIPLPPLTEQKRIAEKVEHLLSKIEEAKQLIEEAKETFELRRASILDKAFRGELDTSVVNENNILESDDENITSKLEEPYQLPSSWKWLKISDLFEQGKEQIIPTGIESYVGLEHLNKGGGILEIGSSEGVKSSKVVFKAGDVLYGKLRPYLNKHAYVTFDGIASTDIIVFRSKSNEKIQNQLLNMYLGLPRVVAYANKNSNGINLPRVSPKVMGELLFPCPPPSEQKYIVETVERLLSKLQSEQELMPILIDNLNSIKDSILSKAFRGELGTNDSNEESAIELLKEVILEQVN
ncbi:restriction endonuclease subunit S [Bacillus infantis]|uniref:restriction endonuclease subunit S n=1 Tax=Bacillus infantis TaxID=324767 RepID=UPI00209F5B1E|nr:restriction endonuclease subunit S [Bacillus infantis]MCP1160412.1 restriction endonuclease subunit S [Bacillus infantis]